MERLTYKLPYWRAANYYFEKWIRDGAIQRVNDALNQKARVKSGRDWPMFQLFAADLNLIQIKISEHTLRYELAPTYNDTVAFPKNKKTRWL